MLQQQLQRVFFLFFFKPVDQHINCRYATQQTEESQTRCQGYRHGQDQWCCFRLAGGSLAKLKLHVSGTDPYIRDPSPSLVITPEKHTILTLMLQQSHRRLEYYIVKVETEGGTSWLNKTQILPTRKWVSPSGEF